MTRIALFAVLLALTVPAAAAEPVSATLAANPVGEVSIIVTRGTVQVVGADGDQVSVEGTRDHESEVFIFERSGDVVLIEDRLPKRTTNGPGTQITIAVPRGSRLHAQLVSADIDTADVQGSVRVNTVSGAVTVRGLGSETEIASVSGDLVIAGASGEVSLETVSGNIEAQTTAARLAAKTVSGTVEIENAEALSRGRLASISGDLSLVTPVLPDVEVELETVSGDGSLTLSGKLDLRLDMIGGPSGDIRNRLDDTPVDRGGPGTGERLEARFGEGRGYVRASTISGTLTVAGE